MSKMIYELQILVMSLIIAIVAVGCPPPRWHPGYFYQIEFGKKKKHFDVELAGGKCKLRFTSRIGTPKDSVIRVFVEAHYEKDAAKDFRFRPIGLRLSIDQQELKFRSLSEVYIPDSNIRNDFVKPNLGELSFDFTTQDNVLWQWYVDGDIKPVEYQLIFYSFVYYKDEVQEIKTIWGIVHRN